VSVEVLQLALSVLAFIVAVGAHSVACNAHLAACDLTRPPTRGALYRYCWVMGWPLRRMLGP